MTHETIPFTAVISLERLAHMFKLSESIELHEKSGESYHLLEHDDRLEEFLAKGFLLEYAADGSSKPDPNPVILWHEARGGYADPQYYIRLSALEGAIGDSGDICLRDGRRLVCETSVLSMMDAIDAAVLEGRSRPSND